MLLHAKQECNFLLHTDRAPTDQQSVANAPLYFDLVDMTLARPFQKARRKIGAGLFKNFELAMKLG